MSSPEPVTYRIEAFDPARHQIRDFRCGSDSQDNFLRRSARRQQRDGYTRVYVATDPSDGSERRRCLGFYALNAHAIGRNDLPEAAAPRAPRSNLIPAIFLSHLAVDCRHQGQGLGRILLVDALQQGLRVQRILGVRLMLLDVTANGEAADRERLQTFYASMGFRPLPGQSQRLFLPLSALPPWPAASPAKPGTPERP